MLEVCLLVLNEALGSILRGIKAKGNSLAWGKLSYRLNYRLKKGGRL
jgi:hypothetical protein